MKYNPGDMFVVVHDNRSDFSGITLFKGDIVLLVNIETVNRYQCKLTLLSAKGLITSQHEGTWPHKYWIEHLCYEQRI